MDNIYLFYDLDGTLIDSSPGIKVAFDKAASEIYGVNPIFNITDVGPVIKDLHDLYFDPEDIENKNNFILAFRSYYDNGSYMYANLYDNVFETILFLSKDTLIKQCIFTNKPNLPTINLLKKFNLYNFFDYISCPDTSNNINKGQRLANYLTSLNGIPNKNKFIFIGDTIEDQIAADLNNVLFIHAKYGYGRVSDDVLSIENINNVIDFLNITNYNYE